jgi:hypothetical protein
MSQSPKYVYCMAGKKPHVMLIFIYQCKVIVNMALTKPQKLPKYRAGLRTSLLSCCLFPAFTAPFNQGHSHTPSFLHPLSLSLSLSLSIYIYIYIHISLSIYLSISFHLSISISLYPLVYVSQLSLYFLYLPSNFASFSPLHTVLRFSSSSFHRSM